MSISFDPGMFKAYDVRGLYPSQINEPLAELIGRGHEVIVEHDAGAGIGAEDAAYEAVGARIADVETVFAEAEIVAWHVKPGDMIDVESCIAQLGGSSIRFYHRMRNAETGADIAGLSQFGVQLDLDARRPSRIADDLRKHAQALLAAN